MELIEKAARGIKSEDKDIEILLYKICDRVRMLSHSACNSECLIYNINGGPVDPKYSKYGCSCFKNGKAMLDFIRTH